MKSLSDRLLAALALACIAASWGCRPEPTAKPVPQYNRSGVHALMAPLRSAPQTFTVTAGSSARIVGAEGTVLSFYPHSFKDAQGRVVSSGPVEISLLELYRPGDMIAHRASTVTPTGWLISGGQIHLTATQNGQELFANGYGIRFPQPGPSNQPMDIFPGGRALSQDSIVTWSDPLGMTVDGTAIDPSQNANFYYQFDSVTRFHWINCDYFYDSPGPLTNVTVSLPDESFNPSNTNVWIIFPSINSVAYFGNYNSRSMSFDLFAGHRIPVGMKFHVVLMSNKGGAWYYAEQRDQTAANDHRLFLSPIQGTAEEVKAKLSAL